MDALLHLFFYLLIAGCILGIILYLVNAAPFLPEPFKSWLWYAVVVAAAFLIIFYILLPLAGAPPKLHFGR